MLYNVVDEENDGEMSKTKEKFNKDKWASEVREAISGADIVFTELRDAFDALYAWTKDTDCSFDDVENAVWVALFKIGEKRQELENLIIEKGKSFIKEGRYIQDCLDMEEIGEIAGGVIDESVRTFGELRQERLENEQYGR